MGSIAEPLTEAEKEHFLTHGYIHLTDWFTKEQAAEKTKDVWTQLGMSSDDKSTWTKAQINMPSHWTFDAANFAPKAWAAICELCGGEDRLNEHSREWRDSFIVNLGTVEGEGRPIPPKELVRWHVDGDFFVHYLDSPEQALLVVPLFTDIESSAGGTMICPEAIHKIAKFLYDHPDGVSPHLTTRAEPNFSVVDFRHVISRYNELVQDCETFVEVTGKIGDVYLLHPLMMHSASHNALRNARIITNPPVSLKKPHCFSRLDGNYSMVEKKTIQSLGGEAKLTNWKITMPRERIFPEMWKSKEAMKKEEIKRMEEARKVSADP